MSLESDVGDQLAGLLRALETASGKALNALQPHSHAILELLKVLFIFTKHRFLYRLN